jgi:hypothetical protein
VAGSRRVFFANGVRSGRRMRRYAHTVTALRCAVTAGEPHNHVMRGRSGRPTAAKAVEVYLSHKARDQPPQRHPVQWTIRLCVRAPHYNDPTVGAAATDAAAP